MWKRLQTTLKHRWMDESDTRHLIAPEVLECLTHRIATSERRHSGEIRIFVEASLLMGYLCRHLRHNTAMEVLTRQRAVAVFGKLRVWDTARNNGVLLYLLLAERKIELVADRGLHHVVGRDNWHGMVKRMGTAFAAGRFEEGLTQALEEVSAPLVQYFPLGEGAPNGNELPDAPELG